MTCTCGKAVHPGTVMQHRDDASHQGIVVAVSEPAPPMVPGYTLVALNTHRWHQDQHPVYSEVHRGDLESWQQGVGVPVRCATLTEVPPPCGRVAPACQTERQRREDWETTHV